MTLHRLPDAAPRLSTTDERLDRIDARIDVLIGGIREILADLQAVKVRFGIDQ
jgi:hypothetical protein